MPECGLGDLVSMRFTTILFHWYQVRRPSTMEPEMRSLPSSFWKGGENRFLSSTALAQSAFHQLDVGRVSQYLSILRKGVKCKVSNQFTNGSQHLVIEVVFEDGAVWIARIRLSKKLSAHEKMAMESEICVMRTVRSRTAVPVPEVYNWDSGTDNVFGAPFILMEAIHGRCVCNDPSFPSIKYKVLDQMASIMVQLSSLRFPAIGSLTTGDISTMVIGDTVVGPFICSTDYYLHFVHTYEETLRQTTDENERNEMLFTCSFYRHTAIPHFIHSAGPFPLCHVDFGLHNTLVNDAGDIVAVIDWSNSRTCPWESFATFPLPISVVWTKRAKYPREKWQQLQSDQAIFVQALKRYEKQFPTDARLSELIASPSVIAAEGFEALMYDQRQAHRWSKIVRGLIDEELMT